MGVASYQAGLHVQPFMKPPPAELHKLEVHTVHRSPLCRQTVRAGKLWSLCPAQVVCLGTDPSSLVPKASLSAQRMEPLEANKGWLESSWAI